MKNICLLLFSVFLIRAVHAQDTVYVNYSLEKLPKGTLKEHASFFCVLPEAANSFSGKIRFYDIKESFLVSEVEFDEHGKKHGKYLFFNKDGSKDQERTYQKAILDGPYKNWYRNGQLKEEGIYLPPVNEEAQKNYSEYFAEFLLLQYWDSLGNQLLKEGTGELIHFHKNGALHEKGVYAEGRKIGEWVGYYEDGSHHYSEHYREGKLINGISYKNGKEFTYTQLEEESQPVGGIRAFYEFLGQNIRYPKEAFRQRKQGTVYVRFIINERGKVEFAEVVEGRELGYGLDEEAIRVLLMSKWTPGKKRGIETKQRKILPIKFKLI